MTNEYKAQRYGELLNEHTRLSNQVSSIKGESIELSKQQQDEIKRLQNRQLQIMNEINKLLS
jgi:uncharacterized protein YdcH (DUF465 family)